MRKSKTLAVRLLVRTAVRCVEWRIGRECDPGKQSLLHSRFEGRFFRTFQALGNSYTTAISWLAYVYKAQGCYAEAELLSKRVLAIYEKAQGPDHRDVG